MQKSKNWWREAVVYQIYPRSYADANGDGIGDIPGIRSKVPYIASLGIDAVWLSPHYPSPMLDAGYDVADYRDVEPIFGTLADIEGLIEDLHAHGIKMMIDIVPNHTSWEHKWFKEALAYPLENDPSVPAKARFAEGPWSRYHLLRGQDGGTTEPNNWISVFGGNGWKQVDDVNGEPSGWWYLHIFDQSQPDLDWSNEEVRAEFRGHLRFWFDRGIDGFRIDVAHGLAKAPGYPDCPEISAGDPTNKNPYWDQDDLHSVWREWRAVANEYEPKRIFVGEAWVEPSEQQAKYVRPDELHTGFNFPFLAAPWRASKMKTIITDTLGDDSKVGAPTTWVLENHDVWRTVSRYAPVIGAKETEDTEAGNLDVTRSVDWRAERDLVVGALRARAAFLNMLALPGTVYMFQGEELGLNEVFEIPADVRQDPAFINTGGKSVGRDGCRVPLPWDLSSDSLGFNSGDKTWLPQPDDWKKLVAESQEGDTDSMLNLSRNALRLRKELPALGGLTDGIEGMIWDDDVDPALLSFVRPARLGGAAVRSVINTGSTPLEIPASGDLIIESTPGVYVNGVLAPHSGVWVYAS